MSSLKKFIKELRLTGGKIAPVTANALEALHKDIDSKEKGFWQATEECYRAANELSFVRKNWIRSFLLGFCAAWSIVILIAFIFTANGAVLAVHYG